MTRQQLFPAIVASLILVTCCAAWAVDDDEQIPAIAPSGPVIDLEQVGAYRLGYQMDDKPRALYAIGLDRVSDKDTGVSIRTSDRYDGKTGCFMHPPYRGGHGATFQIIRVKLPAEPAATLRGSMRLADGAGSSDGVTFRVFMDDEKIFEQHVAAQSWQDFAVDLSSAAGRTVALRFEASPGPKNNTAFDWTWWGDRRIELPGYTAPAPDWKTPPSIDLTKLASKENGSWAPLSAFKGKLSTEIGRDTAVLKYKGADGQMAYHWKRPVEPNDPPLGKWVMHAKMKGDREVELPLMRGTGIEWTQPVTPIGSSWQQHDGRIIFHRAYQLADGSVATLTTQAKLQGKALVVEVRCDQPIVSQFWMGQWGPPARRQSVPTPYYQHLVYYLPDTNLFVSRYLDFSASQAARYDNEYVQAYYQPRTDGTRQLLNERMISAAAWHPIEVMANLPNPTSPWRKELGNRLVLDIWGGKFDGIAEQFDEFNDYGLNDCAAIIHSWQHHGYDNGLPTHMPPNPGAGGDEGMQKLAKAALDAGFLFGLHENYVDYYPNYEHFTEDEIAFNSEGERIKAWFNSGTGIQSFAVKPGKMVPLARTQSPRIHAAYNTNMMFHDVASCVPPWFHVDHRADSELGASMQQTIAAHRDLFAFESKTHEGPVLGEGNRHWLWTGYLDGVEAQFGTGWPHSGGMTAPLAVDFNLLRIAPLQLNHGQGYFSRWWDHGPWGGQLPYVALDQYRMQEIAFGHAGFLNANWRILRDAWLEYHLTRPVTSRRATATVTDIAYQVDGAWVNTTAAAKADDYNRVHITYDNKLSIIANNADAEWDVDGLTLPQFGWVARGKDVLAYTARRDGVVVDYARTPDTIFVNARPATDWRQEEPPLAITPSVKSFEQIGERKFRVSYHWQADQPIPDNTVAFVHFCEPRRHGNRPGRIQFQQDHTPNAPTDGPYEITLPDDLEDGVYLWETGLFQRGKGGGRLPIDGYHDEGNAIRLGVLNVRDSGKAISYTPIPDLPPRSSWYTRHINLDNRIVDFGPIRTDASVFLQRQGKQWTMRTLPRERAFTVQFRTAELPMPKTVTTDTGQTIRPTPDGDWWSFPLVGAKLYSWPR
ncbi:hypothetical protein HED60_06730 [Planctomycetales bacterium ZRK34]|nr:hypothetical protein HED60_06730 [Planctomycetales bacterium ZRK34]